MSTLGEETLAAVVERAQTRCACGRFGVRTTGFCSAECAATAPTASAIATPAAAPRLAPPVAPALTTEAAEEAAYLARMRRFADEASVVGRGAR
jgi:hypothetical protein